MELIFWCLLGRDFIRFPLKCIRLTERHLVESSACVEQVVFSKWCCPVVMFMM